MYSARTARGGFVHESAITERPETPNLKHVSHYRCTIDERREKWFEYQLVVRAWRRRRKRYVDTRNIVRQDRVTPTVDGDGRFGTCCVGWIRMWDETERSARSCANICWRGSKTSSPPRSAGSSRLMIRSNSKQMSRVATAVALRDKFGGKLLALTCKLNVAGVRRCDRYRNVVMKNRRGVSRLSPSTPLY